MDDLDFLDEFEDEDDLDFNDLPLDDEFIRDHFSNIPDSTLENFPFVEDDVDALTDYELFSKGFGYLDDKKADKDEIPDVSEFVKKDEISDVGLTGDYDDLLNKPTLFSGDYNDLTNKPTIPDVSNFITKDVNDLTNYTLTSNLASVATSGSYNDLTNTPTIPDVSNFITKDVNNLTYYTLSTNLASVATTGSYNDLTNKPTIPDVSNFITKDVNNLTYYTLSSNLSTVATSGSYTDLSNKPTIPTVPTNVSAFNNDAGYITKSVNDLTNYTLTSNLSTVATTGSYSDLTNKPTIPDVSTLTPKNNVDVYTTSESQIGTYLGSTVYRKVISGITMSLSVDNEQNIAHNISSLNKVVGLRIYAKYGSATYDVLSSGYIVNVDSSNVRIILTSAGISLNLYVMDIIIDYTKN